MVTFYWGIIICVVHQLMKYWTIHSGDWKCLYSLMSEILDITNDALDCENKLVLWRHALHGNNSYRILELWIVHSEFQFWGHLTIRTTSSFLDIQGCFTHGWLWRLGGPCLGIFFTSWNKLHAKAACMALGQISRRHEHSCISHATDDFIICVLPRSLTSTASKETIFAALDAYETASS